MVSSFWTYVCKLNTDVISWESFREIHTKYNGFSYYGAWQLTYLEPLFQQKIFGARAKYINRDYPVGLCPIAETLQPRLIQFKTNFWNLDEAYNQAKILQKTLETVRDI